MKVRAIIDFYDKAECVSRAKGEEFECTQERMAEMNGKYDYPLVEQVKAARKPRAKKAAPAKAVAETGTAD